VEENVADLADEAVHAVTLLHLPSALGAHPRRLLRVIPEIDDDLAQRFGVGDRDEEAVAPVV
jgi:hypothetical protein